MTGAASRADEVSGRDKDAGRLGGNAARERQEQRRDGQDAKHQVIVSP